MRLLLTRPAGDAKTTARHLARRGHSVIAAPLLTIRDRPGGPVSLNAVQAILVTSANGIRALARRIAARDMLVLAVGAQSAAAARAEGFATVEHAGGDAAALADLAIRRLRPGRGTLLHAAGAETRGALAETLVAAGFTVHTEVLYDAVAAHALPRVAREALAAQALDGVLLYSPRSAAIFASLVADMPQSCESLAAYCISVATARPLQPLPFRAVHVASHPDEDALLALLD
jgi:uroporphyrinogen-III synthase